MSKKFRISKVGDFARKQPTLSSVIYETSQKLKQQFAKDFNAIREGRLCQKQLMFFDPQKIENVKVTFPDLSETDLDTMFHNYISD